MQAIYKFDTNNLSPKSKALILFVIFILLSVSNGASIVFAAESESVIKVATASNFLLPLKYLRADFERNYPFKIKISAASTTKLYAQILNGAPYDIFLAADNVVTKKLVSQKNALPENEFLYAQGRLVLWSVRPKYKTLALLKTHFENGEFNRLALANPKTAPYGRAAVEVMAFFNVKVERKKMIIGESVGQAYQFAASGNVDMGFVALSQLRYQQSKHSDRLVNYWELPVASYRPIYQHGLLLNRRGKQKRIKDGAVAFVEYLKSNKVREVLRNRFGYYIGVDSNRAKVSN